MRYFSFFIILASVIFSSPSFADDLKEVLARWNSFGRQYFKEASRGEMLATDGSRLIYTIFPSRQISSIPIVIVPGMGETALFYIDIIYQLSTDGFGPFFIMDHRGNGQSQRLVEDKNTVHLDNFETLVDDYRQFLIEKVQPFLKMNRIEEKPLLLSHSMGSAVSAILLGQDLISQDFFRAAIFFSPMFKINLLYRFSFPGKLGLIPSFITAIDLNFFDQQPMEWLIASLNTVVSRQPVLGQPPIPHDFSLENRITSSEGHWYLRNILEKEMGESLLIEHVTIGWMRAAMAGSAHARQLAKQIFLPSLVVEAEKDDLVLSSAMKDFNCNAKNSRLVIIPRSKHAIHLENQSQRNQLTHLIRQMAQNPNKVTSRIDCPL